MSRYSNAKHPITLAIFGAAMAPTVALACGNSMVTATPMTYVANLAVLGAPALFFGGIAYFLYRKNKLGRVGAVLLTALPTLLWAFLAIPTLAMVSPFAKHESYTSYNTRALLEDAIQYHAKHGEFPGGKDYRYSNQAGPDVGIDCAIAEEVEKSNGEWEFNKFDETTPRGKKAKEVLSHFSKEMRMTRQDWGSQVVYMTGPGEGNEATATIAVIQAITGFDDEPTRCFVSKRTATFVSSEGKFVVQDFEREDYELDRSKKVIAEKPENAGEDTSDTLATQ
jgi:hypothetical protein